MPQYAGMPEDTRNKRVDPCGCVWWYLGPTDWRGAGWSRFERCETHIDGGVWKKS